MDGEISPRHQDGTYGTVLYPDQSTPHRAKATA
jgi:hypothetical protein